MGCPAAEDAAPPAANQADVTSTNGSSNSPASTSGGSAASSGVPAGVAATPEAAFALFQQAVEQGNWEVAAQRMTVRSQADLAAGMMFVAGFIGALDPDQGAQMQAVLKQHGLDPDSPPQELGDGAVPGSPAEAMTSMIANRPRFIADVMALLQKSQTEQDQFGELTGTLENLTIDGDTATGTVVNGSDSKPIEFARVDGNWLVQIPQPENEMSFGDLSGDFGFGENGGWSDDEFSSWQWMNLEDIELGPVTALTVDDYHAAWRVTIKETDVPAGQLLKRLAEEMQLEWVDPTDELPQLEQTVSLDVADVSRPQAAEEICRQVGLYPRYLVSKMTVAAGERPGSIAFAGPIVIEAASVEEIVPVAAGRCELRFLAIGLPESLVSLFDAQEFALNPAADDDEATASLVISERTGNGGKSLEHPADGSGMSMMNLYTRSGIQWVQEVPLYGLTSEVTSVERIAGQLAFELPTAAETLKFEKLAEDETLTSNGITLKLVAFTDDGSAQVEYSGVSRDRLQLIGRDAAGELLPPQSTGGYWDDNGGVQTITFDAPPASLEVVVTTKTEPLSYDFELGPIALTRSAEQPASIPELSFDGDAPLTTEFKKLGTNEFDQKSAQTLLQNHTNRHIAGFNGTMYFLGADGAELDTFPTSWIGEHIAPGGEAVVDLSTYFAPDETKSVRIEIEEVNFADLTNWRRPGDDE
ncbi:MAG: hypothetical protein R3B90_02020 [Planctomycetaceae bacterium]